MPPDDAAPAQAAGARVAYPVRGILCILAAAFLFTLFNAIAKWLSGDYSPFQIMFFRGLFGLLPLALLLAWETERQRLRSTRIDLQMVRALLALFSTTCFIFAYRTMPLADALAIGYAAPILVTVLSMPMLAERVGFHRWSAVIVGFLGVLLIIQPGVGVFDPAALWAMLGALLYALMIIITRRLGAIDSTACTMLHSNLVYLVGCGLLLPFLWVTPGRIDLGLFVAVGLVTGVGMFFFIRAYYHGQAATIAPFDYSAMVWAIVIGFVLWGDIPGWLTLAGMVVVAAAGVYITRRETMLARHKPLASEMAR